jgi:hypothetical protein
MRLVLAPALMVVMAGCAHGLSNEARLDAATTTETQETVDVDALRCRDSAPEVQLARDASAPKVDRIARYDTIIGQVKATAEQFDEEFRKDPDLVYGPQAAEWQHRRQLCTDLISTFERERKSLQADLVPSSAPAPEPAKVAAPVIEDEKPVKASKAKSKKDKVASSKKKGKKERLARAD